MFYFDFKEGCLLYVRGLVHYNMAFYRCEMLLGLHSLYISTGPIVRYRLCHYRPTMLTKITLPDDFGLMKDRYSNTATAARSVINKKKRLCV